METVKLMQRSIIFIESFSKQFFPHANLLALAGSQLYSRLALNISPLFFCGRTAIWVIGRWNVSSITIAP